MPETKDTKKNKPIHNLVAEVAWENDPDVSCDLFDYFQRHIKHTNNKKFLLGSHLMWGFDSLELDTAQLQSGLVGIRWAVGIFPDGSLLDVSSRNGEVAPMQVTSDMVHIKSSILNGDVLGAQTSENLKNTYLLIATPRESDNDGANQSHADIYDYFETQLNGSPFQCHLKRKKIFLTTNKAKLEGYSYLPFAKVEKIFDDGSLSLDKRYVAPFLRMTSSEVYTKVFLQGILQKIEDRLYPLTTSFLTDRGLNTASVVEATLLQLLNRYKALFYSQTIMGFHPQELYFNLLIFANELSSYAHPDRTLPLKLIPPYCHENNFKPLSILCEIVFKMLNVEIQRNAIQIMLMKENYIYHSVDKLDGKAVAEGFYILSVKADAPLDHMRKAFPVQCKIAARSDILAQIKAMSTSIALSHIGDLPQDVPYSQERVYFELLKEERSREGWELIKEERTISFHVTGDYPHLDLQLWQVNVRR